MPIITTPELNLKESVAGRSSLVLDAAQRAANYLDTIGERSIAPTAAAQTALAELAGPLPEAPIAPEEVLALLDEVGSPATVATAGGRYFGFVIGGSVPAALAANVLAAAWDQNAALRVMSPVAAALEDAALAWLRELLGFPPACAGSLVTGASMANFTCIVAARSALLSRLGWNVETQGLFGAPPFRVFVSQECHISVLKALSLAGLGRERVEVIPTDNHGRMQPAALPKLDAPALICVQAGNVNTGSFDPAREICALACESQSWVHVDGAFGLWAICSPAHRHLVEGFCHADSWATDAHKWLNVPYDCGLAFVRDAQALHRSMSTSAAYLQPCLERDPMQWSLEMSRRARGVEVWAALKSLGRSGVRDLVERTCRHAQSFAAGLCAAGFNVLNDVVSNQVLVSFGTPEVTRAVIAAVQQDGTCWCGPSSWQGNAVMRISVSSWVTDEQDVARSLEAIIRIAHETIN